MGQDNYTIEQLESIAEGKGEAYQQERRSDVNKYIKHFNVVAGADRTPAHIIYYHYRKWRKQNYMSRSEFFKHFKQIFDKVKDQPVYMLDSSIYDMSLEGSLRARVFLRKDRDAKRKRRQKSKS